MANIKTSTAATDTTTRKTTIHATMHSIHVLRLGMPYNCRDNMNTCETPSSSARQTTARVNILLQTYLVVGCGRDLQVVRRCGRMQARQSLPSARYPSTSVTLAVDLVRWRRRHTHPVNERQQSHVEHRIELWVRDCAKGSHSTMRIIKTNPPKATSLAHLVNRKHVTRESDRDYIATPTLHEYSSFAQHTEVVLSSRK